MPRRMSITRMAAEFASDNVITKDESKALVDRANDDGVIKSWEKSTLKRVLVRYSDLFEAGAKDPLLQAVGELPPPPPPAQVIALNASSAAHAPVFLTSDGVFTVHADGRPPQSAVELGDALYRAADLIDDLPDNVLGQASFDIRQKAFTQLETILASVPAGGPPPAGLDENQALQLRATAATVLLHLLEASPEPDLKDRLVTAYETLVRAETEPRMREPFIFHLYSSSAARDGRAKQVASALMRELAPLSPPYEKWFANGNSTVNLSWTVGQGEFWKGFTNQLKGAGFKAVGPEDQYGVTVYEATFNKPGVGDTTFRISVREGGSNVLAAMNDPDVQIVGYDGHSNWGRNMSSSVRNGPQSADGADGKLLFYNLCVGKGVLDKVKEKYWNAQVVTTYAASNFYTDGNGQMTTGEGVQALIAMVNAVAARSPWSVIHTKMNQAANIGWGRTWDNYVTPVSSMVREKVLDRDNDGQADYLDKVFSYNLFNVAQDTAREFTPVKQDRPADSLDGTKVLMAGNMINTLSEFSTILDRANPDSKVIPNGYYEPGPGEHDLVRFSEARGADGKTEYHMQVNARAAHMSEDALRAVSVYEFNRYLAGRGLLGQSGVDAKLAGLIVFAQSLRVDEGGRDSQVFEAFKSRYSFPADIQLGPITSLLLAEHHAYAGSPAMVRALKEQLSPDVLAELAKPEVGVPAQIIG